MAKQTLPVNFKDDILNSSMGGKRRYNLIQNSDGTVSLEDVTSYTQVGSDFGAAQMNQTNKAVNESCDKANVIDDLDDIMANQASGMIAGAKAVAELNGKTTVRAETSDSSVYAAGGYISLGSKDTDIATFASNGVIHIKKNMRALINVHINGSGENGRGWITLGKYNTTSIYPVYATAIAYGNYQSLNISTVQNLKNGDEIALSTTEQFTINNGIGYSYIEITEI